MGGIINLEMEFAKICKNSRVVYSFQIHLYVSLQVEVIKKAYLQGEVEFVNTEEEDARDEEDHDAASPRNVGHNIYILAHQVGFLYLKNLSCFLACMQ